MCALWQMFFNVMGVQVLICESYICKKLKITIKWGKTVENDNKVQRRYVSRKNSKNNAFSRIWWRSHIDPPLTGKVRCGDHQNFIGLDHRTTVIWKMPVKYLWCTLCKVEEGTKVPPGQNMTFFVNFSNVRQLCYLIWFMIKIVVRWHPYIGTVIIQ